MNHLFLILLSSITIQMNIIPIFHIPALLCSVVLCLFRNGQKSRTHLKTDFMLLKYCCCNIAAMVRIRTRETLPSMTVAQLKEFAASHGIIVKGKKADIISTITANISVADLEAGIVERKYCLTSKGEKELSENAYVPLMHKAPDKTIEDDTFGEEFNVWVINRKLGENGWNNADAIIQEIRDRIEKAQQKQQ